METWKVAIALAMSSNHASVLSALSSGLLGVHSKVKDLEGGFNRLKFAIGGALSVTAGMTIFHAMEKLVDKTKEYSDELVKLKNLGGDMAQAVRSGDISKRAFDISQRVPMSVTDLMKIPGATNSIIGTPESMEHWETFARTAFVLQSQKDYHGDVGTDLQNLIKAGDLSGRITDPKTGQIDGRKLDAFLDTATRAIAATHGLVNPQTLLGMAKQGGFTLRGLSDDGFLTQIMLAQAMGGPRAGTAYLSLWQQMAGGTMMSRTAQGMEDVGLLKPGEWQNDHGHVILQKAASSRLTKLIGTDPMDLAANLVEHFKKQGITDPLEQMRMTMRALGRQTTQRYTAEEVTNFHQMIAERERIKQAAGVGGSFGNFMNESVSANMVALQNAWNNLLTAFAGPNSQNVITFLQTLTGWVNSAQRMVTGADPEVLKNLGIGLGVLAGALTAGGAAAMLAALGPAGWLAAGLVALAAAASQIDGNVFAGLGHKIAESLKAAVGAVDLTGAFSGIGSKIWDAIKRELGTELSTEWKGLKHDFHALGIDPAASHTSPGKDGKAAVTVQPVPNTNLTVNLDSRQISEAVIEWITKMGHFPTSAPASDGAMLLGP